MKTPLWMVNSILMLLSLLVAGFILFMRVPVPRRTSIEPDPSAIVLPKKEISKVQLSRIYNNDLFNTYIQPTPPSSIKPITQSPLPTPPPPKQYQPPPPPAPSLLDPLNITLKGIIWQGSEEDSRAIIADQTGKQNVYQVGDKIEDGYVLGIAERRITLLRSNGQQEILYIDKEEAARARENDLLRKQDYSGVIQQINSTTFVVDPDALVQVVRNLGQLIDALHLSSVYNNGEPIGVRIGAFDKGTIGTALGLQEGDAILAINNTEATNIKKRLEIYQNIINLPLGSTIKVMILRGGAQMNFYYRLEKIVPGGMPPLPVPPPPVLPTPTAPPRAPDREEQKKIMSDAQRLAPIKTDIKKDDKRAMLKKGMRQPLFKTVT